MLFLYSTVQNVYVFLSNAYFNYSTVQNVYIFYTRMLILNYSSYRSACTCFLYHDAYFEFSTPFLYTTVHTYLPVIWLFSSPYTPHLLFLYICTFYICFVIEEALLTFRFQCLWAYRCG